MKNMANTQQLKQVEVEKQKLEKWQEKLLFEYFKDDSKAAYDRLTQEQKNTMWSFQSGGKPNKTAMINYVLAPEHDRALFDSKKMSDTGKKEFLRIGSSRVMKIFSDGYVKFKQMMAFTGIGIPVALTCAFLSIGVGIYCETYQKNKEILQVSADAKDSVGEKAQPHFGFNPEMVGKLDNHAEMIGVTQNIIDSTKTVAQYKTFVSTVVDPKSMQCEVIGSLEESFMDSKTHLPTEPRCKKDGENVWVESYVSPTSGSVKPVFGVFHQGEDGKWQYSDFDLKDFGLDTAKIDGVQTLDEKKVPEAFIHAFPEMNQLSKAELKNKQ